MIHDTHDYVFSNLKAAKKEKPCDPVPRSHIGISSRRADLAGPRTS